MANNFIIRSLAVNNRGPWNHWKRAARFLNMYVSLWAMPHLQCVDILTMKAPRNVPESSPSLAVRCKATDMAPALTPQLLGKRSD